MRAMYWFQYDNGHMRYQTFDSEAEAGWFAHNEGDHLVDWGICAGSD